eukprot:comp7602_c0_seq1/m.3252 comp7602_c0_seq1/g.3252  ORF comp7602_c0_seq1/g.3252 comp7602_c0_seq1/m.3252 type:complete len:529 (-) comp7602_c0_seq1:12-1598(-)
MSAHVFQSEAVVLSSSSSESVTDSISRVPDILNSRLPRSPCEHETCTRTLQDTFSWGGVVKTKPSVQPHTPDFCYVGKTLLLVLSGSSGRRALLESIHSTGAHIVCFASGENWAKEYVSEWIVGSTSDLPGAVSSVRKWVSRRARERGFFFNESDHVPSDDVGVLGPRVHGVDGVLCYDEFGLVTASLIAKELGLPFISHDTVNSIRNKYAFRQTCLRNGVPTPRFLYLGEVLATGDLALLARQVKKAGLRFPLVVKPTNGAGSFFVTRAQNFEELCGAIEVYRVQAREFLVSTWGMRPEEADGLYAEELITGTEVDIDCVVQNGEVLFHSINDNRPPTPPYFMEQGGVCPSALPNFEQNALVCLLKDVVSMFGKQLTGCFHFEAMVGPDGAVPIELNLRIGGAETFTMVKTAYGVNLGVQAVNLALGFPLSRSHFPQQLIQHTTSINFVPSWEGAGRIAVQEVDEAVYSDPDYATMQLYYKVGDVIRCPPDGFQYLGWMVAKGATKEEAEENLRRLVGGVRVVMESP